MEPTNHLMTDNQTDWRALCDELLEALYYETGATSGDWTMLRAKAEAALAQPKPPSLKEQALEAMREMQIEPCIINGVDTNAAVRAKYETIRRALEALPDD